MKIMLIQTPWSESTAGEFKKIQKRFTFYPPIGLMYLAAFVEKNGHKADILDLEVEPLGFEKLCSRIASAKADFIGITSTTPIFHIARSYAKRLKESMGLPVVVGGPHITALGEKALTDEFDFAVTNEGEHTLVELMDSFERDKGYAKIDGLIYSERGEIRVNTRRAFIEDLDSLPFPARSKLDPYRYIFEVPGKGLIPVANAELTRGCPFQCVFCAEPVNTGKRLRSRSAKNVADELCCVKKELGITHFFMLDSTLTLNRTLIEDFCNELINRRAGITFEGQTRANLVDNRLLKLMKRAGLVRLSFGLESSNRRVLTLMKKQIDPESVRNAFRLCRNLKISTMCGTMMGNPGDTKETILETARFVRSIPEIRYAPMAIAVPYPGTELHEMARKGEHGLRLLEDDYRKYSRYEGGVMEIDGMKQDELIKLQRRALFIMHATPSKMAGLIQHFGFFNLLYTIIKMMQSRFCNKNGNLAPATMHDIRSENTTLNNHR